MFIITNIDDNLIYIFLLNRSLVICHYLSISEGSITNGQTPIYASQTPIYTTIIRRKILPNSRLVSQLIPGLNVQNCTQLLIHCYMLRKVKLILTFTWFLNIFVSIWNTISGQCALKSSKITMCLIFREWLPLVCLLRKRIIKIWHRVEMVWSTEEGFIY